MQIAKICDAEVISFFIIFWWTQTNTSDIKIYATVDNLKQKQTFLDTDFEVPDNHIFLFHDKAASKHIMIYIDGRSIDVILPNSHNERSHKYWRCVAFFDRFVDIGRNDEMNRGNLDMNVFRRHATFMSFDLSIINVKKSNMIAKWICFCYRRFTNQLINLSHFSLMTILKNLYQQSLISPIPTICFHASEIESALTFETKNTRTKKIVVTYEHTNAGIQIKFFKCIFEISARGAKMNSQFQKSQYKTKFNSDATYFLVDCLDGLDQLCNKWMIDKKTRDLTYFFRSEDATLEIRNFIAAIENRNVAVHVIKENVTNLQNVKRAVACNGKSVKNVVQAAFTLQIFSIAL